ncbi:MAG: 1-deoxy-D-xylulose-5-phosphate synthase [Ruminococcus sp.]|nr:1-deoxy-D-xylulose-5-phosphate synthase [Ruminococcus sp.]
MNEKNKDTNILKSLSLPGDLKNLSPSECRAVCREIRKIIIKTVSENGGHLASNLGTVELTLALHRVFESPKDKMIWDVGHQAYTHKLLTGRLEEFSALRKEGGISGFAKPGESEHDIFISGHSSNSISAACGIAAAMNMKRDDHSVIAVIGDGALTGGMAFEGLNNAAKCGGNLIIVLNDNEMSISKNVGSLAKYLSSMRGRQSYVETKHKVEKILDGMPIVGKPIKNIVTASKDTLRWFLYHSSGVAGGLTMFENLGFVYLGPVDGHNLESLEETLKAARAAKKPVLVHVKTVKGKGYKPAENNPGAFHGVAPRIMKMGDPEHISDDSFSAAMGRELLALGREDNRICAVTAAMKYATGLNFFAAEFPKRFFDVGIAEQHAVTFAAGLAVSGMIPVFAVYSSFLQRAYDQIIHDAAICSTHIVLAVDRAGVVGEDGETHQGLFDVPMLTCIPGVTVFSPGNYGELAVCLKKAVYDVTGVAAVRYPRGAQPREQSSMEGAVTSYSFSNRGGVLAIGYGRTGIYAEDAAKEAEQSSLRLVKIFPLEEDVINICKSYKRIVFFEESQERGGIGELLSAALLKCGFKGTVEVHALNGFIKQADSGDILKRAGLDKEGIMKILTRKAAEDT